MAGTKASTSEESLLEEEIGALKAIFSDGIFIDDNGETFDVIYLNTDGGSRHMRICFSIPENYPNIFPSIQVLVDATLNEELTRQLLENASELLGSPMLFSLISTAQDFVNTIQKENIVQAKDNKQQTEKQQQNNDTSSNKEKVQSKEKIQCKFFQEGKCRFGDRCFNLHGQQNSNNSETGSSSSHVKMTSEDETSKEMTGTNARKSKLAEKSNAAKQATKNETPSDSVNQKKKPMKTATDVIHRILWDDALPTESFVVGYLDRFVGIIEKPFTAFSWEDLASVDINVLAVPKHRIQYFKYLDVKVWDKQDRMDKVFGSTGNIETVLDIIARTPIPDQAVANANTATATNDEQQSKLYDDRNRPNHFLCIRITDDAVKRKIKEVQAHILEKDERLVSVMHDSDRLHVTLCMFRLESDKDKLKAVEVLKSLEPLLPTIVPLNSFNISVRYLDHFRQRVVYAGIEPSPELLKLAELARIKLKDAGVHLCGNYDVFSPHMTFLKLTRPFSTETLVNEIPQFIYEGQKNVVFGKQTIDSLKICETGPERGEDNFYTTIASISNNLLCVSPKLVGIISERVEKLMKDGVLDEGVGDEILGEVLSGNKEQFEKAILSLENYLRERTWDTQKHLIILRGLPGSGKSFLSDQLMPKESAKSYSVCGADKYFEKESNGSYKFTGKEITNAHGYCRNQCIDAIEAHIDVIIIDNTHTQRWEYRFYERMALLCGYKHHVVEMTCNSESTRYEFMKRCTHQVKDTIHKEMYDKWEPDAQAILIHQHEFKLVDDFSYILNKSTEQPILYSALFLDIESRKSLLHHYPASFKKVFADHMTIMYQPTKDHLRSLPVGEPFRILVSGYYCRAGVQMVSVMKVDSRISPNVYPHVTISTTPNIPPRDAAAALESCACALPKAEIILSGVVGVQIATGPKTSVKCLDKNYVVQKYLCDPSREGESNDNSNPNIEESEIDVKQTERNVTDVLEASLYTGPLDIVKRIYIFDFDGTLFETPDPKQGREEYRKLTGYAWPHHGWLGAAESLEFPLRVYPGPSLLDYWDHIDRACSYTVLCTGRLNRVKRGVVGILKASGLTFDEIILKPDDDSRYSRTNVAVYKRNTVTRLLKRFHNVEELTFWDDRIDNIEIIKSLCRKNPAIKFNLFHVEESAFCKKLYEKTTSEIFSRMGLRPTQAYQAAVNEGMEIIQKAWFGVMNVAESDAQIILPFGSYCLERRSDIDVCILAPKHNKPDVYLSQLADKFVSYGIKYVHCATGIRCPRLKVKLVYYNSAPVVFDIVMACVLDHACMEIDATAVELRKRCIDEKSKIALSGPSFLDDVVAPACTRLSEAYFGMVVEAINILLKRWRLKGNAFHCIRTFHVVQLVAEHLSSPSCKSWMIDGLDDVKEFEKFLRQVLIYIASLSFDHFQKMFKGFVPDAYIQPLLRCFEESSASSLEEILFTAPRLNTSDGQYITLKLKGECPVMIWKAMSILEARVGTFIRQIIDGGFEVCPEETTPTHLSFFVRGSHEMLQPKLKEFVGEFEKEIQVYSVSVKTMCKMHPG